MVSSSSNPLSNLHLAAIDEARARNAKIDGARRDALKAQSQLGYYRHLEAAMAETFGADNFDGHTAPKAGSKRGRQALEVDDEVATTACSTPPPLRRSTRVVAAAQTLQPPSAPTLATRSEPGANHAHSPDAQKVPRSFTDSSGSNPTQERAAPEATTQKAAPQDSAVPQTEKAVETSASHPEVVV